MKRVSKLGLLLSLAAAVLTLTACPSNDKKAEGEASTKMLVASDLADLKNTSPQALRAYDAQTGGLFTQVFGSTDPNQLQRFVGARIKSWYTNQELEAFRPTSSIRYTGWAKTPSNGSTPQRSDKEEEDMTLAQNYGMVYFLAGLAEGRTLTMTNGRQSLVFNSSRVGIMRIGGGYKPVLKGDGRSVPTPPAWRQATLLHEARHSDCTGGYTQADIQALRNASTVLDTLKNFNRSCGHLHDVCPEGHAYAGMQACDSQAFGAYSMDYMFMSAVLPAQTGTNRAFLEASVIDRKTRFTFDPDNMTSGKMGRPDMSHAEAR